MFRVIANIIPTATDSPYLVQTRFARLLLKKDGGTLISEDCLQSKIQAYL